MLSPAPVSLSQAACFHCNLLHSITPAQLAFVLWENKMDFTNLFHSYPTSIPVHRTPNIGGMVVVGQLQHLTHLAPPLLRHLSAPVFLVQNAPFFEAWVFHWNYLCLVHQISQQGREKGQMALLIGLYFEKSSSGASGASRTPSLWLCWNGWGRWVNQILEYLFYFYYYSWGTWQAYVVISVRFSHCWWHKGSTQNLNNTMICF